MKKGVIVVCLLALIVLLETIALIGKYRNPEPTNFTLDSQEFILPKSDTPISPFVFETNFVEQADTELSAIADELDGGFGIHLSQIFNRLTLKQQETAEFENEKMKKFDEFRRTMLSQPVNIRGAYLGDNQCEVDGVRGICANGVYKLDGHCIACFDGFCAGTDCADENSKEQLDEAAPMEDITNSSSDTMANSSEEIKQQDTIIADEVISLPEESLSDVTDAKTFEQETEIVEQPQEIAPELTVTPETPQEAAPEPTTVVETPAEPQKPQPIETETPNAASEPKVMSEGEALIAVVIDDIGLSVPFTNQIANINHPLTVSFLPYGASNKEQVNKLKNAGFEVMLHAPMMPRVPADLAPVTLSPKMSKAEIQEKLLKMMERFEGTGMHGINNHMGSAFTESREAMGAVMEILRERNMYFLDSKTTSRSVGRAISKEYGVPYVARDVFLDNERRYDYIMGQFRATEKTAKNKGYAIAIGHPYPQTLQALNDWLKDIEKRGIKIVPISDLVAKLNN